MGARHPHPRADRLTDALLRVTDTDSLGEALIFLATAAFVLYVLAFMAFEIVTSDGKPAFDCAAWASAHHQAYEQACGNDEHL